MSDKGFRVEIPVNFNRRAPKGPQKEPPLQNEFDDVPRIARLLALAHKWEGMVRRCEVGGYMEIAKLMGISRGRVAQLCSLTFLAPDLQEALLGSSPQAALPARIVRLASSRPDWIKQRLIMRNASS